MNHFRLGFCCHNMKKKIPAWLSTAMASLLGVNWKVRASALTLALVTSTVDYAETGGKMTLTLLVIVWGGAIKSFFTKSVGVSNAPNPLPNSEAVVSK